LEASSAATMQALFISSLYRNALPISTTNPNSKINTGINIATKSRTEPLFRSALKFEFTIIEST